MKLYRRICVLFICLCTLLPWLPAVQADTQQVEKNTARNISDACTITADGYSRIGFLTDGDIDTYRTSAEQAQITLENANGIGGLYLLFDLEYGAYTIGNNDTGATATAGSYGFLHEYIDLKALFGVCPKSVTLQFDNGSVRLSEIYALSDGTPPDFVQTWDKPLEGKADIVLFSTHGDDDQLFFAGLMPLYAKARNVALQVVYMTDHRNITKVRTHEMLNGLWAVGVTAYPVFGNFKDFRIDDLEGTYREYERQGRSREELQGFVVEQVRRFRPQVAIGHDLNGEYGHGMHMVYADLLVKSLALTADPSAFPESAQKYGLWDIPKLYLHLYKENPIVLDYDTPLNELGGLTPFEVTQKYGFPCHKSQQWTDFTQWLNGYNNEIKKASQIYSNNPTKFGLYRSTVGEDVLKNDFMENIVTYAEQERLEQERLEQERLEQERLEQERLEQERLEADLEAKRLEQEQLEQALKTKRQYTLLISGGVLVILLAVALVFVIRAAKRRRAK